MVRLLKMELKELIREERRNIRERIRIIIQFS